MKLSPASEAKLKGVKPPLQDVVRLAAKLCDIPFIVVEGLRSFERQSALYAQGRTKPGKVVTWTMQSKHLTGDAVDLAPIFNGAVNWEDIDGFEKIGVAMREASLRLHIPVRWGYDWDGDGRLREKGEYDGPHFELV